MTNHNELCNELLKQNGMQADSIVGPDRVRLEQLVARESIRVRRMKWATGISWGLVALVWGVGGVVESFQRLGGLFSSEDPRLLETTLAVILSHGLIPIAVICTISLYLRSRTATTRQIQLRLANIEEQLGTLSEKQ